MFKTTGAAVLALCTAILFHSLALAATPPTQTVRVILVGDSTMARNSGYGEQLCAWFKPQVACVNVAKGGRSSRSYREEGSWAKVMELLADKRSFRTTYVLLQFGHNDQPGRPERSTTLPQFTENMARYVKEVRDAGDTPVLVTPLTRREFKDGKIVQDLEPWAAATRQVAQDNQVALLDLNRDSERAVNKIGPTASNELAQGPPSAAVSQAALTGTTIPANIPPADMPDLRAPPVSFDYTHVGPKGGEFFAAVIAKEIRGSVKPLARHMAKKPKPAVVNASREFPIWRTTPPGGEHVIVQQSVLERSTKPGFHDRALLGVTTPTLTVYKPDKPDGSGVLVIPGGSYLRVVLDKEGEETARRLNEHGITAAVLVYRLPGDGWAAGRDAPLQDAQRAMRLLRSGMAGQLDPARIGVLGFSAGGDLAAAVTLRHDEKLYEPVDQADLNPVRPDFSALIYPALDFPVRTPSGGEALAAKAPIASFVKGSAPPTIIIHAANDTTCPVEGSLQMFSALKAANVPAEMHIFEDGGHGFGVRAASGKPVAVWPDLVVRWGVDHKFFTGP